jgi:hypothetical protein
MGDKPRWIRNADLPLTRSGPRWTCAPFYRGWGGQDVGHEHLRAGADEVFLTVLTKGSC